MEMLEIEKLTQHPRNKEFFDDIHGDRWEDFKKSVVRRGIVEPIVVTQELMIVSGHQRVRACKEIGLLEIPCRITYYPDYGDKFKRTKEDMILEDLISTNIMQRGVGNVNPMKMAKCIIEMERLKGVRSGSPGKRGNQHNTKYTQRELAEHFNMTSRNMQRYKQLTYLIPEFQQMVEEGSMKSTCASKLLSTLGKEIQTNLINILGVEQFKTKTEKELKQIIKSTIRKPISKSVENHLISRSKGKCEICNFGNLSLIGMMEKHHIIPIENGGADDLDNLTLLCPNCHKLVHILIKEKEEKIKNDIVNNFKFKEKLINLSDIHI